MGSADLDFFSLYKIYELVRTNAGGTRTKIVENGWASAQEVADFEDSANEESTSGPDARRPLCPRFLSRTVGGRFASSGWTPVTPGSSMPNGPIASSRVFSTVGSVPNAPAYQLFATALYPPSGSLLSSSAMDHVSEGSQSCCNAQRD